MLDAFYAFLLLFIIITYQGFSVRKKLRNAEHLLDWVAGIGFRNSSVCHCYTLRNIQTKLNLRDEYKISTEEEWKYVEDVIESYRKHLVELYFQDKLWVMKTPILRDPREVDYFFFMLYVYLCERESSVKPIAFYKMLYIAYMYCDQSPVLHDNVVSWNERRLRDHLDALLRS